MPTEAQPVKHCVLEEILAADVADVSSYLAHKTGLPKGRIKHALNCGALRVKKRKGGLQRVRRATAPVPAGSQLSFHYDETLLALRPGPSQLLADQKQYSIWFKPPGVLSQGTEWGDHCSLLRQVELHFAHQRQVFLVHRLDRDACGLMLVAHTGEMAHQLSQLFASRAMEKHYRVRVAGVLQPEALDLDAPLDGKAALTHVQVLAREADSSLLAVQIETGRKHQIRRHLAQAGHPVLGDVLYGNDSGQVLHLAAIRLRFCCPIRRQVVEAAVAPEQVAQYWS